MQESEARTAALSTSTLNPSNKGYQMMAKLGFKKGDVLGRKQQQQHPVVVQKKEEEEEGNDENGDDERLKDPINLTIKHDRGGIGLDTLKRKRIADQQEEEEREGKSYKKAAPRPEEYRERMRIERETKRFEGLVRAAQIVAERLDYQDDDDDGRRKKPLRQINVLYRGMVREREERNNNVQEDVEERGERGGSGLPDYDDETMDPVDKLAVGKETCLFEQEEIDEDDDDDDQELEAFNALDPRERLMKLVVYMREEHLYCFWCKFRYHDQEEMGAACPGLNEEDHE